MHVPDEGLIISPTGRSAWRKTDGGNMPACPPRVIDPINSVPYGTSINTVVHQAHGQEQRYSAPEHHRASGFDVPVGPRNESWDGVMRDSYHGNMNGHAHAQREPAVGPQTVELDKIRKGVDVRTTVMLRNIPNRLMRKQFSAVLEECTYGRYDFSYLRIDFRNLTNVGYAFVNFACADDIITFSEHFAGKYWPIGNKRLVQLSYATVQGFDCLVEKFRNSSVLTENIDYRPQLHYTAENAPEKSVIGKNMAWPAPNNMSKHNRSLDNAKHVGLYAPRTAQLGRERSRQSQFDRGTLSQMYEAQQGGQFAPMPMPMQMHPGGYHSAPQAFQHPQYQPNFGPVYYTGPVYHQNQQAYPVQPEMYQQQTGPYGNAQFNGVVGHSHNAFNGSSSNGGHYQAYTAGHIKPIQSRPRLTPAAEGEYPPGYDPAFLAAREAKRKVSDGTTIAGRAPVIAGEPVWEGVGPHW